MSPALRSHERSGQGKLQGEFLLGALGRVRQSLEQLQSFGEVAACFNVRRAPNGFLACLQPVRNGLHNAIRLGVVMSQQFRLGVFRLRKARLQYLGTLLMELLALALQ
jgi:hypothetical protein